MPLQWPNGKLPAPTLCMAIAGYWLSSKNSTVEQVFSIGCNFHAGTMLQKYRSLAYKQKCDLQLLV